MYEADLFGRRIAERAVQTDTGLGTGTVTDDIVTRYEWDADSNMLSMTDALGRLRRWQYDVLGRVTATVYPDGSLYDLLLRSARRSCTGGGAERDRAAPSQRRTRPRGRDHLRSRSRLASGVEVGGGSFERFTYDALDRRTEAENDFVRCQFSYSSLGLAVEDVQHVNHPDAPGAPPLTVTRGFDDAGDLVRLTYPGGREVVFERDAIGRTVTVDNVTRGVGYPGRVATPDAHPIARIAWAGRRLGTTRYPGGTETELAADAAARVTAIGHTVGGANALRQSHLFDGVGNLRVRQEATAGTETAQRYSYDSLYRLANSAAADPVDIDTGVFIPPATPAEPIVGVQPEMDDLVGPMAMPPSPGFEYDASGNRTLERSPGEPVRVYATNELDQYTAVAGTAHVHDANGNLTADGVHRYVYDVNDRLSRVIDEASGQEVWRAVHDALGRRALEIADGVVHRFVRSGDALVAEHGPAGPLVQYVVGPTPDRILQIAAAGEEHRVHTDLAGSTRLLSDSDGNVTATLTYSPFGELLEGSPPEGVRILFGGRRIDPTGTYEHRARTYDPRIGRFLQRDPGGLDDGPNPYTFAGNNPLTFVDPSGRSREERTTGFFGPRLVNTGRGTGGHPPTLYENEEGEFIQPGQRGILAIEVDPEAEARLAAQRIRKAIAQRRAFDNIERDVRRAMDRGATWMAVWAGALFAAPFLIEAGIVFLPWVVRGGGSLTTRVYLGGSEAGAHLAAGVEYVRRGQHAGGVGGGADRGGAGHRRLAHTIQLPPLVAAERERRSRPSRQGGVGAAAGGQRPTRGDAAPRARERQISQRDGGGPRVGQVC